MKTKGKPAMPTWEKGTSSFALLLVIAASLGCQDSRVTALEQRVGRLEQSVRQLESERDKTNNNESARRANLESCVAEANAAFDRNLVTNGTKARNGSYNVSVPVLAEMQRQKQGKIEECRLLYSK
jgi:uncharacterized protein HemX